MIDQELLNACVINSWSVTPRMMLIDSMIESGHPEFKAMEAFEPPTISRYLPSTYRVGIGSGSGNGRGNSIGRGNGSGDGSGSGYGIGIGVGHGICNGNGIGNGMGSDDSGMVVTLSNV